MKAVNDINFLASYWAEAKRIAEDIKGNLSCGCRDGLLPVFASGGAKMFIVKFSDLKDSWSPNDIIYNVVGASKTLNVLADKIHYMIYKGRANDVKPMIEKICSGRIKKLSQPITKHQKLINKEYVKPLYTSEFLGYGHFRWNRKAYTLNEAEIKHLKQYFNI